MKKKVIIPLPDNDFDLTEVSIPWKYFVGNNIEVIFATEKGKIAQTDPLLMKGVIFGQLGAKPDAIAAYRQLEKDKSFTSPILYAQINPVEYDLLLLPGGHAKGMKQYLEDKMLQQKVVEFFKLDKLIAAICHGSIVLARSIDYTTHKSIIYNRKLTGLIKSLEKTAYYITAWKLGNYYRTYPTYVQDEIKSVLVDKNNFLTGKSAWIPFVVEDKNLITARWPNDAHLFAQTLLTRLLSAN